MKRRRFLEKTGKSMAGIGLMAAGFPNIIRAQDSTGKLNIGIIGTGDRGEWLAYILKKNVPEFHLTACCDILPKHLKNGMAHADSGAIAYNDYRKMLDNKDLDAVIVCTPLYLHYQMAIDALSAQKHIFCEKTMTYNIEQAIQLSKAVKQSDRTFQVGYQSRNNPLLQEIKEMLDSEVCGQITQVRCNYHRNGSWRRPVDDPKLERLINWRMYREYSGGLMAELCSHHIDLTNWMLDAHPERATGFGGIDYWKDGRETYDNVNTVYEYPGGIKAIFTSITTNATYGISLQYMGTLGTIEIYREEGQEALFYAEKKLIEQEKDDDVDAYSSATRQAWERGEGVAIKIDDSPKDDSVTSGLALKHFAECIRDKKMPVSNVNSGLHAAIAVHMGNNAMRSGEVQYWKPEYNI